MNISQQNNSGNNNKQFLYTPQKIRFCPTRLTQIKSFGFAQFFKGNKAYRMVLPAPEQNRRSHDHNLYVCMCVYVWRIAAGSVVTKMRKHEKGLSQRDNLWVCASLFLSYYTAFTISNSNPKT